MHVFKDDKIAGTDYLDASNNTWEEKLEWSEFCESIIEPHNSNSFKHYLTCLSDKES